MGSTPVRVRFAPSPTGFLHVGGARTALFNWLFARHNKGTFVLRVEDTDSARYADEYVEAVYRALRWLKLDWDEGPDIGGALGPYRQRERGAMHREVAQKLLASGAVYECYCGSKKDEEAADESENDDDSSESAGTDGAIERAKPVCRCSALSDAEKTSLRAKGVQPALRMRVDPQRAVIVDDLVRGRVEFPAGTIGDFVIVKSDGGPLYNFAAVVDDHAMRITHVIRGEEHLANTPKQLLLYEALGWEPPLFAHIPIILNEQRRKLSKRDGATFVNEYEALGFLPDALVNFLGLLGWSPGGNRELLTRAQMLDEFTIESVVKHPAIFDHAKLAWMNKEYLKALPLDELAERVIALLEGRASIPDRIDPEHVRRVASLLHERAYTVAEIVDQGAYFFTRGAVAPAPDALAKYCSTPEASERLKEVRAALAEAPPDFDAPDVENAIRGLAQRTGRKAAEFIHPLRVAVTGQAVSPGIFEVCSILGREVALERIDALLARLSEQRAVGLERSR
ncbi:MAG: glutamate--tRNA ligase [Candidatus Eremiobacteraeota bacterium]|nr:glutamate--tRNA ligase [Candidatus Eremiobacteraeota bacterium]